MICFHLFYHQIAALMWKNNFMMIVDISFGLKCPNFWVLKIYLYTWIIILFKLRLHSREFEIESYTLKF